MFSMEIVCWGGEWSFDEDTERASIVSFGSEREREREREGGGRENYSAESRPDVTVRVEATK